ncbi:hypothetical protein K8S17_06980, partial [bacterium]|nr:hypothetical protein [bacterium]
MAASTVRTTRALLLVTDGVLGISVSGDVRRLDLPPDCRPTAIAASHGLIWLGSIDCLWCGDPETGDWHRLQPWPSDRTQTGRHPDMSRATNTIRQAHPDSRVECTRRITSIEGDGRGGAYAAFTERYFIDGSGDHEYAEWQAPGLVRCEVGTEGGSRAEAGLSGSASHDDGCPLRRTLGSCCVKEVYFDSLWDETLNDIVVSRTGEVWLAGSCAVRLSLD